MVRNGIKFEESFQIRTQGFTQQNACILGWWKNIYGRNKISFMDEYGDCQFRRGVNIHEQLKKY